MFVSFLFRTRMYVRISSRSVKFLAIENEELISVALLNLNLHFPALFSSSFLLFFPFLSSVLFYFLVCLPLGEKPPVKAYLTGAALLSPVPPLPMTAATIGPGTALKNVPALRTAVSAVKVSSLPKPVPVPTKVKAPSPTVRVTPPTSPMIATIPPPVVPLISLEIITEESDAAAADSAHTDSSTEPLHVESVQSNSTNTQDPASASTVTSREARKTLPLPLPLPLTPVTGALTPSRTHPQPQWAKSDFLNSDKTLPPNPHGIAFEESNLSSVAVLWPLDSHTLPSDLCEGAEERFEIPWGKNPEEESVPECAEKELNTVGKEIEKEMEKETGKDKGIEIEKTKDKDRNRDGDGDVVSSSTGSLSSTRHLSLPLFSSKDRDLDIELRSSSLRSLRASDELKIVRTYSRTQSLLILGSESLDEKLRRRLSAVEFPIGKIGIKNKGKEKQSDKEKEKGKDRVEARDKEKEIEEILKERLVGVRGSR
jgi:hypothetical protein